ncbi:uncharacterized protein ACA1_260830 [Acanthamoeba castellanii str. Neff]|uniref:Uncharacterized protein n=1 Tax=Acanthamoeba castellanii (strain ATCC 30010 / Neff) TaxID=1257118 RepID=L8GFC3_ACACF|nr:uncharacterized protein ACA1_260830 [Acanthamoeba castellanii str. Neff]ELR11677.1 hypothetical protein ACA1_260830 [Acanthamoeba castellanii str. Neff]
MAGPGVGGTASGLPQCIGTTKEGNVKLTVHVKPNAKISAVTDMSSEAIGVALAAPPRDGEANAELVDFMAGVLEARKKQVELVSGSKSRDKVLLVTAMTPEQVHEKLRRHLDIADE